MKTIVKYFLMVLWLLFFSIAFLLAWIKMPGWYLSNILPEAIYASLMRALGVRGAESAADMEMLIALGLGFLLAGIILVLFLFIRKRKRRTDSNRLQ